MKIAEEHQKLYKQIPNSTCKEGCFDCCGPIPMSKWEAENIGIDRYEFIDRSLSKGKKGNFDCEFIKDGKCSIYDKRPFMCRLFGTTERLKCKKCTPEYEITEEKANNLSEKYIKLMEKED